MNHLDRVEELVKDGADGIITDCELEVASARLLLTECISDPNVVRRWAKQNGLSVAPKYPKQRVLSCLHQHMH